MELYNGAISMGVPCECARYLLKNKRKGDGVVFVCMDGYRWSRHNLSYLRGLSMDYNCVAVVANWSTGELRKISRQNRRERNTIFAECKGVRSRKHGPRMAMTEQSLRAGTFHKTHTDRAKGTREDVERFGVLNERANRQNCFIYNGAKISKAFIVLPKIGVK